MFHHSSPAARLQPARRRRFAVAALAASVAAGLGLPVAAASAAPEPLGIEVVSSHPDAISGGDARVRIQVPDGVDGEAVRLSVNGTDVTADLSAIDGGLEGVVDGLRPQGGSLLRATGPGVPAATLQVQSHPSSGPIFAGEHQDPFYCETEDFTTVTGESLGPALDEHCTVEPRTDYLYRSAAQGTFEPLTEAELSDPDQRPDDIEIIEREDGTEVPFIVEVRTQVINRGVAEMSMLHDPADPEVDGWNEKLIYRFGGGCTGGWYSQGRGTAGVLTAAMLADGYALASNSLNVFGSNCNDLLAAEAFSMTREAFIEQHGEPLFTMGWGSSGGAYQAHQIADNYPGMLDGVIVGASFPDVGFGMSQKLFDTRLLQNYRDEHPDALTEEQWLAVSGFRVPAALEAMSNSAARLDPDGSFPAVVPEEVRFDAETNPGGARSTVWDHTINAYGQDPETGYALRPFGNIGVQYGLQALQDDALSMDEFLDLNDGVGGADINLQPIDERISADAPAVQNAYATGRMLSGGGGLSEIPIIDHRQYTDAAEGGDSHMRYHGFSTRERLVQAAGNADNHVMLTEPAGSGFDPERPVLSDAIDHMDAWILAAQQAGGGHEAVVATRPDALVDACWTPEGEKIAEEQTYDGPGRCNELYPSFASPRIVAGGPLASNVVSCELRPVDPAEYGEVSAEQLERLAQIFPEGVCDWTQPGQGQQGLAGSWIFFTEDGDYRVGGAPGHSRP